MGLGEVDKEAERSLAALKGYPDLRNDQHQGF